MWAFSFAALQQFGQPKTSVAGARRQQEPAHRGTTVAAPNFGQPKPARPPLAGQKQHHLKTSMETPILKADPEVGTATPVAPQAPPDPTLPWKALSLTFFLAGIALAAGVASSGRGGGGGSDDDAPAVVLVGLPDARARLQDGPLGLLQQVPAAGHDRRERRHGDRRDGDAPRLRRLRAAASHRRAPPRPPRPSPTAQGTR